MRLWSTLFAQLVLAATVGCAPCSPTSGEGAADDGKADSFWSAEGGGPFVAAILAAANGVDLATLESMEGLRQDAARSIADARDGADGILGTADDEEIESMEQLDGLPRVGTAAIRALFRHADLHGFAPEWPTRLAAPPRVIAIGDVHGDLAATREALRLAGAIDETDRWVGGDLVVVQLGDVLDRGDDEHAIGLLFDRLRWEAAEAGGLFVSLLGNHETMNVAGDFRYVTDEGLDWPDVDPEELSSREVRAFDRDERPRAAAFLPGNAEALRLARRNVVVVVGETLFVHGGLLPDYAGQGLERLNHDVREWMVFEGLEPPRSVEDDDGPFWYRGFGDADQTDCGLLAETLEAAGASRMVVSHTVQDEGITTDCDGRLYRVDVGLSAHYGSGREVLEIEGDSVEILRL